MLYFELLVYSFGIPLPKLVLLLLYIRIFPTRIFKLAVFAVGIVVIAWCPAVFFTNMFQCNPVPLAWDKSIKGGTCIDQLAFFRYIAVPTALCDAAVLILPLPLIWQLHKTLRQKSELSILFSLGSIGMVATMARRLTYFRKSNHDSDHTWNAVTVQAWTMAEVEVVLIAACLPRLKPLFAIFWQSGTGYFSSLHRSSQHPKPMTSSNGVVQKHGFALIQDTSVIPEDWNEDSVPMALIVPSKRSQSLSLEDAV